LNGIVKNIIENVPPGVGLRRGALGMLANDEANRLRWGVIVVEAVLLEEVAKDH
jgi:hypothetical protein